MDTLLRVGRGGVLEHSISIPHLDRLHRCTEHYFGN
jgi:hypothetical protein